MKKAVKILCVFLIMSMVFITLSSCGSNASDTGNGEATSDKANGGENDSGDADGENTIKEIPFPHEVIDCGGATFKILIDKQWSGNSLDIEDRKSTRLNSSH